MGLRPARTSVRLESEIISSSLANVGSSGSRLLVHCYGVGGCGFTIGMGLAEDVIGLVEPIMT